MVYAEGDNRFKSYCLRCQIGKSGKEEDVGFIGNLEENGKEPGPLFSTETTELLTVTDNYYETQNNGLHNSVSFLLLLFFYFFCN